MVKASFVRTKLYDIYDDLTEATTLLSVCRILTKAFEQYEITFIADPHTYQGFHPLSFKETGIVGAEIHADSKIRVELWREVLYVLAEPRRFELFVRLLSAAIRHELVHREQTARSKTKCHEQHLPRRLQNKEEWVEYYGDTHELGAMAHEIIENFEQARLKPADIIKEMSKPHSSVLSHASMRYCDIMEHCHFYKQYKETIARRLKKNIYQVLCN